MEFKTLSAAVKIITLLLAIVHFGTSNAQLQLNDSEETGSGYYYVYNISSLHELCPSGEVEL